MDGASSHFQHVSRAPTHPRQVTPRDRFDVANLYRGPLEDKSTVVATDTPLDEKLRQAYFWLVNHAIISPYYDIEYNDGPAQTFTFGDAKCAVTLPSDQSYSSYILLPLLNLAVRRKCLLVGGPGRGKTAIAILMGVLAGYDIRDVKRAIQHGQPQMTISDLLGNPLPATLVSAQSMDDIHIAWRKWLGMRIKIIDEYNRIPTRTQSTLLTVMADNYAELLDQIFQCPDAAWYLTANDDAGGGTYQVIEALQDRIDVVVKALHFNTRFLGELLARIEQQIRPEEIVPQQIIFNEQEMDRIHEQVLDVALPPDLRRRIEFFASHFEFCEHGASQLEYRTKDTVKLAGQELHTVMSSDTGKDKTRDLGSQTLNGLSVRALMTTMVFVKAMAFFRGQQEVTIDDVRQILPFVLHDKLAPNLDSPFFEEAGHAAFRIDKIGWLRTLFDRSCAEYDRLDLDRDDPVFALQSEIDKGLEGVSEAEVKKRLVKIERLLNQWSKGRKLYGHVYDDILKLKYMHQRYSNYVRWLQWTE